MASRRGLVALVLLVLVLYGCSRGPEQAELRGATMGTTYSVTLVGLPDGADANRLHEKIDALLAGVNASMSTYDEHSELSRFNASASTEWYGVSAELARVVAAAQRISEESGGAFDVTVGPLVNLWGFGPERGGDAVPDEARIAAARALAGFRKLSIRLDPPALRKAVPGLYVDLSAIAKGYGVDRVAGLLDAAGIRDYLVEIGGELRGRGRNAKRAPWRIAVERPDPAGRAVHQVVSLSDAGMATSGDYRNFFEQDGRRYSHTIDPSSGYPVTHDLASVTVLGADAMNADAHATALLVMGVDRGVRLAEKAGIPALFISRTAAGFETYATARWPTAGEPARD